MKTVGHLPEGSAIPAFLHESARPPKGEIVDASVEQSHILIFCTSLQNEGDVRKIAPLLENLPGIISWSVDLEDCDKVLRVVSSQSEEMQLLYAMERSSFDCRPMPD